MATVRFGVIHWGKGGEKMKRKIAAWALLLLVAMLVVACEEKWDKPTLGEHDWMRETGPVAAPMATEELAITHRAVTLSVGEEHADTAELTERITAKGQGELLVPYFGTLEGDATRSIFVDGKEVPADRFVNAEPDVIGTSCEPTIEELMDFLTRQEKYETLRARTKEDVRLHTLELDLSEVPENARVTLTFDREGLIEIGANAYGIEDKRTVFTWTKNRGLTRAVVLAKDEVPDPVSVEITRRTDDDIEKKITAKINFSRGETTVTEEMGAFWDAYAEMRKLKLDDGMRALAIRAATAKWLSGDGEPSIEDVFGVAMHERRLFVAVVPLTLGAEEKEVEIRGSVPASYNFACAGPKARRNLYGLSLVGGPYDTTLEVNVPASSRIVHTSDGADYNAPHATGDGLVRIEYTRPEPETRES